MPVRLKMMKVIISELSEVVAVIMNKFGGGAPRRSREAATSRGVSEAVLRALPKPVSR